MDYASRLSSLSRSGCVQGMIPPLISQRRDKSDSDSEQPDRYLSDPLSSADSANQPNPHDRDHWMFGAG